MENSQDHEITMAIITLFAKLYSNVSFLGFSLKSLMSYLAIDQKRVLKVNKYSRR